MTELQSSPQLTTALQSMSDEALASRLQELYDVGIETVIEMAAIVREFESRGKQITIRLTILPYLRKIAYGNLLPALFMAAQGNRLLLNKASSLPTPDQDAVARNEPMAVWESGGDHRMVRPQSMSPAEIQQVFANGKLRDESEQIGWIKAKRDRDQIKEVSAGEIPVVLDRKRGGVLVGQRFLSAAEMARCLAELSTRK